jgi:hypothetical protein
VPGEQILENCFDIQIDGVIGTFSRNKVNDYLNGRFYEGTVFNAIIADGNKINLDRICNSMEEPDILIETKYWKILKFRVKEKPVELRPKLSWKPQEFMKMNFQKLDMDFERH